MPSSMRRREGSFGDDHEVVLREIKSGMAISVKARGNGMALFCMTYVMATR